MTDTAFDRLVEAWDSVGAVADAQNLPAFVATTRNKTVAVAARSLSKAAVESIARTAGKLHQAYPAVYCTECLARGRVMAVRVGLLRRIRVVVCQECGRSGALLGGVDTIAGLIGGAETPVCANGTAEIPLWNEAEQRARYLAVDKLIIRKNGVSNYDRAIASLVNAMTADVTRSVRELRQISVESEGVDLSHSAIKMLRDTFGQVSEAAQPRPVTETDALGPEEGVRPLVVSKQIDPAKVELIYRQLKAAEGNSDGTNALFHDDCQDPWVEAYNHVAEQGLWLEVYNHVAEQGHAGAQCSLGEMHEKGRGVQQSDTEAIKWYRRAAEHGYEEAISTLCGTAEQGQADAQFALGEMYEKGRGVRQSDTEAVQWYCRAAEQGHNEAMRWLRHAAEREQGLADVQFTLGEMHEKGRGVQQSDTEAIQWYRRAAEQGHDKALRRLRRLDAYQLALARFGAF